MAANRKVLSISSCGLLYTRLNGLKFCDMVDTRLARLFSSATDTVASVNENKTDIQSENVTVSHERDNRVENRRKFRIRPKSERLDIDKVDWPSLYSTASSYNSWLMPLPVRMGRSRHNKVGGLPVRDMGNIELLKIPNFFHLTPPAIERHCEALKALCTPWPRTRSQRPVKIITKNFLFAGPSLRHPKSHIVHLKVSLENLTLDVHARRKLISLAAHRYNKETDELTIVADRCPTRNQNRDYAKYLLNVLYHESWKTESWELEDEDDIDDMEVKPKKRRRRRYKIIDNELYRLNKYGKAFKVYVKQHGDRFSYDH